MVVKLKPTLKSYLWGGTNLIKKWHKETEASTLSEAWELSCHPEGLSVIGSGEYAGKTLAEVLTPSDLGEHCAKFHFFPVLNKLIDTAQPLSIQVHPTDEYALAHEGQYGKTEMWHILEAEKGAFLYLGLKFGMTPEEFAAAIEDNTILNYLNRVPVHPGETYFIPVGTIHAIGAGITLYEVQQNSNLTYRIYDYERRDAKGNKRELHVDKAKKVADLSAYTVPSPDRSEILGQCEYFTVRRLSGKQEIGSKESFTALTLVQGSIKINDLSLTVGETAFISAGERVTVEGDGTYLVTTCIRDIADKQD